MPPQADAALELQPAFAEAHNNRGAVLIALHRPVEALAAYDRALELNAEIAEIHKNRAGVLSGLGYLGYQEEAIIAYEQAVGMKPDDTKIHSDMLFFLAAQARLSPDLMLEELRRWDQVHGQAGRLHPLPVRATSCLSMPLPRQQGSNKPWDRYLQLQIRRAV